MLNVNCSQPLAALYALITFTQLNKIFLKDFNFWKIQKLFNRVNIINQDPSVNYGPH